MRTQYDVIYFSDGDSECQTFCDPWDAKDVYDCLSDSILTGERLEFWQVRENGDAKKLFEYPYK